MVPALQLPPAAAAQAQHAPYQRRGRSDEDLSPHSALNDPVRSEDIVKEVKFLLEAHGNGFRRELLQDIRQTLLDHSDKMW